MSPALALKSPALGVAFVVGAAVLWGSLGVFVRLIYSLEAIRPLTLAVWRGIFALPILAVFAGLSSAGPPRLTARFILLAFAFAVVGYSGFQALYLSAFAYTTIARAATLLYTAPAFVAVMSRLFFKERLTVLKACAVALAILGAALVVGALQEAQALLRSETLLGDLLAIMAGLAYSSWFIFGKVLTREADPPFVVVLVLSMGVLVTLPLAQLLEGFRAPFGLASWLLALGIGIGPTALAYVLYLQGLKLLEPTKASIYAIAEPLSASVMAYLAFNEALTIEAALGAFMILMGIVMASL